ncbi:MULTISPECIES: preprotein translocase subunit SecG [Auritidibacter]|uniref:Protein-export membrane protein SecG n=1 Tax=Auritidibacter ignavus TaxID=678932 RepID=A0AAJ6DCI5_9MICC|nr:MULTISPECIES: preprotein translocase subunit SecG [Auritidibacter]PXA82431.1 preprotein translocase subunit SecG [Auritidibacter sp. NML120779]AXR73495.1 preprotein translocase subunit SecG [Auritidibacter sp. NML130574]NIH70692.1 preprotein translocase subunit SecG [Auritidibacter ignavus]PXA77761.1 preprotein translocase subunit SecG [Auritidibacter sp. NML100628]PXA80395.1 preprotein translocase subunit SecG [Auritidibacter sp. NML120636]
MEILQIVLQILLVIISVSMVLLILLHKGRGGGMSDMFGGGVTSGLSSSGVAQRNLTRLTVFLGVLWGAIIIVLALLPQFMREF